MTWFWRVNKNWHDARRRKNDDLARRRRDLNPPGQKGLTWHNSISPTRRRRYRRWSPPSLRMLFLRSLRRSWPRPVPLPPRHTWLRKPSSDACLPLPNSTSSMNKNESLLRETLNLRIIFKREFGFVFLAFRNDNAVFTWSIFTSRSLILPWNAVRPPIQKYWQNVRRREDSNCCCRSGGDLSAIHFGFDCSVRRQVSASRARRWHSGTSIRRRWLESHRYHTIPEIRHSTWILLREEFQIKLKRTGCRVQVDIDYSKSWFSKWFRSCRDWQIMVIVHAHLIVDDKGFLGAPSRFWRLQARKEEKYGSNSCGSKMCVRAKRKRM